MSPGPQPPPSSQDPQGPGRPTCTRDPRVTSVCKRGTYGCAIEEHEPTLLDKLDQAEARLMTAEALPEVPPALGAYQDPLEAQREWRAARTATIAAAAAHFMAASARCLATTERGT